MRKTLFSGGQFDSARSGQFILFLPENQRLVNKKNSGSLTII